MSTVIDITRFGVQDTLDQSNLFVNTIGVSPMREDSCHPIIDPEVWCSIEDSCVFFRWSYILPLPETYRWYNSKRAYRHILSRCGVKSSIFLSNTTTTLVHFANYHIPRVEPVH